MTYNGMTSLLNFMNTSPIALQLKHTDGRTDTIRKVCSFCGHHVDLMQMQFRESVVLRMKTGYIERNPKTTL
jgi:hypothetical protein